jgi:O-antigen ligase
MSGFRAALTRLWLDLRQPIAHAALHKYLLDLLAPASFALLVSATIRLHSMAPMQTLARTVTNLLAIAAVALLVLLARGSRLTVPKDVGLLLLAFAAAATVSVVGSGSIDISLLRLELYVAVVTLGIVIYLMYRDHVNLPLEAYLLAVAVVHIPFLVAVIVWVRDAGPPFWENNFRVPLFSNVRQFAEFGFLAAVSATGLCVLSRRLVVPSALLATAAVFGLILTGSRGAALGWILFVLLTCALSRARVRAAFHGLFVLAVAAALVWSLDRSGVLPSPNIFARVHAVQVGHENFDNSRISIWLMSLQQIATHPFFGSGPEGYWISGCCYTKIKQAHNFVLQFLLEFGVIGCGIVLLIAARTVKKMGGVAATVRLSLATPENRVLVCLLLSFLAYGLIDQMLYHLLPLVHFGLFAGLFAAGLARARAASLVSPAQYVGRA